MKQEEIIGGLNKAYLEAGHNAYFGNGFHSGVKFASDKIKEELIKHMFVDVDQYTLKITPEKWHKIFETEK